MSRIKEYLAKIRPHFGAQNPAVFPLIVLRRGHVVALAYGALMIAGAYYLLRELLVFMLNYVEIFSADFSISAKTGDRARVLAMLAACLLSVPFVLTALVLPCRLVWIYNRIPLGALLRETFSSLRLCLRSLLTTPTALFFDALPALALLACYLITKRRFDQESLLQIMQIAVIVSFIGTVVKVLPRLMTPIIAICGLYPHQYALMLSQAALGGAKFKLAATVVLAALCIVVESQVTAMLNLPSSSAMPLSLAVDGVIIWYALIALTGVALKALTAYELAQREPTPIQQSDQPIYVTSDDPNIEVISARHNSANGQPIVIEVRHLQNGNGAAPVAAWQQGAKAGK